MLIRALLPINSNSKYSSGIGSQLYDFKINKVLRLILSVIKGARIFMTFYVKIIINRIAAKTGKTHW